LMAGGVPSDRFQQNNVRAVPVYGTEFSSDVYP